MRDDDLQNAAVDERERLEAFERVALPHLDAAYNLARWLAGNDHDAQDVAQEAALRAFRFFAGFRGDNARAWLLTIVRNTFHDWLRKNRPREISGSFDDQSLEIADPSVDEDALRSQFDDVAAVRRAVAALPVEFREIVVLREMEGLSYKQIAEVSELPIGTVMSRLARARRQLQKTLLAEFKPGGAT